MKDLIPITLILSFTFLVPAHPGSPIHQMCLKQQYVHTVQPSHLVNGTDRQKDGLQHCFIQYGGGIINNDYISFLFNSLFSRTSWVSRHQKGKPLWISMKQVIMGWQWHQLDHMQVICISLQTDITMSVPYHSVFKGRMPFLLPNQGH